MGDECTQRCYGRTHLFCGHHPRRSKLQIERRSAHQYYPTQSMMPVALPSALQGNFKLPVDENDENDSKRRMVWPG